MVLILIYQNQLQFSAPRERWFCWWCGLIILANWYSLGQNLPKFMLWEKDTALFHQSTRLGAKQNCIETLRNKKRKLLLRRFKYYLKTGLLFSQTIFSGCITNIQSDIRLYVLLYSTDFWLYTSTFSKKLFSSILIE